jgi:hypothetical protein
VIRSLFVFTMLLFIWISGTPKAQAQSPSFVFDSFLCSPAECVAETLPTFSGAVEVTFESTCTNGDISGVFGISGFAESHHGILVGCTAPYISRAEIDTSGTELLDDCGFPYFVDTVTEISENFLVGLSGSTTLVFHKQTSQSCDASESGTISFGSQPC